jgi:hypothetical protein
LAALLIGFISVFGPVDPPLVKVGCLVIEFSTKLAYITAIYTALVFKHIDELDWFTTTRTVNYVYSVHYPLLSKNLVLRVSAPMV